MSTTIIAPAPNSAEMKNPAVKAPPRRLVAYGRFIAYASLYLLPLMRIMPAIRTDEGTLLEGGVRVAQGQVFARDFFEVMGPGSFYWLAAFFKLFGINFLASRIDLFVTSLGTGVLIYFFSRRICKTYQLLPCILIAAASFGSFWPGISHHIDSNFFALLSFAFMILWHDRRKTIFLLAAGVIAGVTTCFIWPKGVALLVAYLAWLAWQRWSRTTSFSSISIVLAGFSGLIGAVTLYFWSHGALRNLIDANFIWPSHNYGAVNNVPYAQGLILNYWNSWVNSGGSYAWTVPLAIVLITPLFLIAALPGILVVLGGLRRKKILDPLITLYLLGGSALWISEFHRRDVYHLVTGSPLLIILAAFLLMEIPGRLALGLTQILLIFNTIHAGLNLCLPFFAHPVTTPVGSVAIFNSDPALNYLNNHISPAQELFVYPYSPTYYFLSATTNPTPYSFLLYSYNTPEQYHDAIRILDQHKTRYVLWDMSFLSAAIPANFPSADHPPPGGFLMEPYLQSHYKVVWSEGKMSMLERKAENDAK